MQCQITSTMDFEVRRVPCSFIPEFKQVGSKADSMAHAPATPQGKCNLQSLPRAAIVTFFPRPCRRNATHAPPNHYRARFSANLHKTLNRTRHQAAV